MPLSHVCLPARDTVEALTPYVREFSTARSPMDPIKTWQTTWAMYFRLHMASDPNGARARTMQEWSQWLVEAGPSVMQGAADACDILRGVVLWEQVCIDTLCFDLLHLEILSTPGTLTSFQLQTLMVSHSSMCMCVRLYLLVCRLIARALCHHVHHTSMDDCA